MIDQLEKIAAKIQSKVATFLGCRERLYRFKGQGDDLFQNQVNNLLVSQALLEKELPKSLEIVQQVKAGQWTVNDLTIAGDFYYRMSAHIDLVNQLEQKVQGKDFPVGNSFSMVGLAIGALVLFLLLKN